jgi:hypothetical protein
VSSLLPITEVLCGIAKTHKFKLLSNGKQNLTVADRLRGQPWERTVYLNVHKQVGVVEWSNSIRNYNAINAI